MAEMIGLTDMNQLSLILREVRALVSRGAAVEKKVNKFSNAVEEEVDKSINAVEKEVDKLIKNFLPFQLVLDDALNMQLNDDAAPVQMTTVKDTLYDIDDALDEWITAVKKGAEDDSRPVIRKVCSLIPSYLQCHYKCLVLRRDIGFKIKSLNKTLECITKEKLKFNFSMLKGREMSPSFLDLSEVCGRDAERTKLLELLLSESSQEPSLPVISIVGSGGIGKTTLARFVFYDTNVNTHFNKRIWVSASYPCDEIWIAKAILKSLKEYDASDLVELETEFDASDLVELETVLRHIGRFIRGKKFLLVLDNIQIEDLKSWEQLNYSLKCGCQGSRILVTTREENAVKKNQKTREENAVTEKGKTHEENVVRGIGTTFSITLRTLSEEDSWHLFRRIAILGKTTEECEKLVEIGRNIMVKCKGLPIAVKILGSLLSFKRNVEDWKNVLDSEIWELAEEKELLPPLLLSYYDLPIILRKCFSYCAIFPKNYEIEKSRLIKLWMSQNYLKIEGREDMELIGEEYFENLVMLSFFQVFQINAYNGSIISCKMHDIVYDFAQFIAKNESFIMDVNDSEKSKSESSYKKVPHLMIIFEREGFFPIHVYNDKKLRSLVVESRGGFMSDIDLGKLFDQLTCLRTLDLSNYDNVWYDLIKEVPNGIKKFIHLRYLNLSSNRKIKDLPKTFCELYNLQTLELHLCTNLKKLPQGIGKLINLRHLVNDETSLSYMPKGIERLTSLRTLSEFIVTHGGNVSKACTLECLKNLNHLRSLGIKKLGNVTDVKEAENAKLRNKENLHDLHLNFQKDEEKVGTDKDDEKTLESLQPPPNLEKVEISYYRGKVIFSTWVMSLTKLRLMSLDHCKNLENLPSLGRLPFLESLIVRSMKNVKRVGDEILGIDSHGITSSSSVVAFPKLKYLKFQKMKEWEEWAEWEGRKDAEIMPCLRSLTIDFCPKLKKLPNYIRPVELKINSCPLLKDSKPETYKTLTIQPSVDHSSSGKNIPVSSEVPILFQIDAAKQV